MIHLRIRTEYTFKQTFCPIERAVQRLKAIGCAAAGIVDREGTWGHVLWSEECRKNGIKPIFGVELVVSEEDDIVPSMWFLAKNLDGLREMYHFSSKAYKQKIKTKRGDKPRLFLKDVISMSENIFRFAGDILDKDFLIEAKAILDLNPSSRILNMSKERIAKETGLSLVSTSDNYYAYPEDKETFELIDGGIKPTPQFITEDVKGFDEFEDFEIPRAPMIRAEGDLEKLCRDGIAFRKIEWNEIYEKRLRRELDLIRSKDFDAYFIVVSDMVCEAKKHMLVGPSRGSSAGSLVCYLTRITEIDPIKAGLIFERFIDESRKDLPDIDIDFPGKKRHLVFEYMKQKYVHTANIGTVQRYRPSSALIQTCKKLGIPPIATAGVKAAMIVRSSGDARATNCLRDTLDETRPGQILKKFYPDVVRACDLEGHASHTGTHAAGLIVCNVPIEDYCTVQDDGTAQVEKKTVEPLNLLKVDVLGLRTLDILEDSGIQVDWYGMRFDDPKTWDIFNQQMLSAIFQFDGQSMRNLSSQITFSTLNDVDAVTALARPGPFGGGVTADWLERRNGKKYIPFHPLVEAQMKDTYGMPVYQEQTMAIVREIGQFDWTNVSSIRKAVSLKKGKEFFNKYLPQFIEGAKKNGLTEEEANRVWEYINSMGAYQMNRAHTYSYAVISYWTAWLKAHHPAEFAAANMRNAKDEESSLTMLQEMARCGLKYEPFNLQKSKASWSVQDGTLVAGFDSLKGFGEVKAKKFAEDRDNGDLTESQLNQIQNAVSVFSDLFPMHRQFKDYYTDWKSKDLMDRPLDIAEIDGTQHGSLVYIGRLIQKNLRDANEDVNVKKRGGRKVTGPVMFIDFRVADDSGRIQSRIDRMKYASIGKQVFEAPIGTVLLIRAYFNPGIRFGFVQKIKILDKPTDPEKVAIPSSSFQNQSSFKFQDDGSS